MGIRSPSVSRFDQEIIDIDGVEIHVTWKPIRNIYLRVHRPDGRVSLSAPEKTPVTAIRAFISSRIKWIERQRKRCREGQAVRPRNYVDGESLYLWGRAYRLTVIEQAVKPFVRISDRSLTLSVRPGSGPDKRASVIREWYKSVMHEAVPGIIARWVPRLGVTVTGYTLRRMRSKWGSCSYLTGRIRLNTELAAFPVTILEYVIVHEMVHLLEPSHNAHFYAILDRLHPAWREAHNFLKANVPASGRL